MRISTTLSNSQAREVLEGVGYSDIRGNRASCPNCEGHRRHTVSIHGELFYCHRCNRGGSVRNLAQRRGIKLPPARVRRADKPKKEFYAWLAAKMTELAKRELAARRQAEWAKVALHYFPDMEPAWHALAAWYDAQRTFETFWQSASDRIGRYWLYRHWRRSVAR